VQSRAFAGLANGTFVFALPGSHLGLPSPPGKRSSARNWMRAPDRATWPPCVPRLQE
jgi:hypothetical protein